MKTYRRKFPPEVAAEIVRRATDNDGKIRCSVCGIWLKSSRNYEIDHIQAEGVVPPWRKARRLTAKDGQLLCKAVCHKEKTSNDQALIAEAKRREAKNLTLAGQPEIARRYAR